MINKFAKIKLINFALILSLQCFLYAHATTYYVDQKHSVASDDNTGTEPTHPWKTLKHAALVAKAGETVIIKAGKYIDDSAQSTHPYPAFNTRNSGTSGISLLEKKTQKSIDQWSKQHFKKNSM